MGQGVGKREDRCPSGGASPGWTAGVKADTGAGEASLTSAYHPDHYSHPAPGTWAPSPHCSLQQTAFGSELFR